MRPPAVFLAAASLLVSSLTAQEPGTTSGSAPQAELKDLNGYFPFTPPASFEQWVQRSDELRLQMRVALGIWPEPTRTPLKTVIHGRIEQPDYTVEKVYFESMPGFFVTGNLFRPRGKTGPFPAVLCPHGHWPDGRFQRRDDAEMKKELDSGGERFLESGRSIFQSLGVQLARMGCVAFVIDMLGYADSQQISFDVAHKFAKQRPEMNTPENWGLFSPQAEAHLQSIMGLQTWNGIRALDFLTSLPDVDPKRIGCTGASGGGTQTFILGALDPRVTVTAPAVMVSTAMQGGCTCENACLLRIGTGNVEFAALFAPKPQGLTAANDWTKEVETKGFPELKAHYTKLSAPDNIALWPMLQFGHNYNLPSREKIYGWLNRHFALGLSEDQLHEREYAPLTREQLSVWDATHPTPPGGDDFERNLLRWWYEDTQTQMARFPERLNSITDGAWTSVLGKASAVTAIKEEVSKDQGSYSEIRAVLTAEHPIPVTILRPKQPAKHKVLWLHERGRAGLLFADGQPQTQVRRLLDAGVEVTGVDLFWQEELPSGQRHPEQNPLVKNPRESAAYTYGYNRTVFAKRVNDAIAVGEWLAATKDGVLQDGNQRELNSVSLVALDSMGPVGAAVARSLGKAAVLETAGFRFGALTDWRALNFLPGAVKYGDLYGLLMQTHPKKIYLLGESSEAMAPVEQSFRSREESAELVVAPPLTDPSAGIDWLLEKLR